MLPATALAGPTATSSAVDAAVRTTSTAPAVAHPDDRQTPALRRAETATAPARAGSASAAVQTSSAAGAFARRAVTTATVAQVNTSTRSVAAVVAPVQTSTRTVAAVVAPVQTSTRTVAAAPPLPAPWRGMAPAPQTPEVLGPGLFGPRQPYWPERIDLGEKLREDLKDARVLSLAPELLGPLIGKRPAPVATAKSPRPPASMKSDEDDGCTGLWNLPRMPRRTFDVGEELGYDLSIAGAYIGRFETKVGKPRRVSGRRVLPLFGRARTSGFASAFRPFVGRYMAMALPDRLMPIGLRVEATYADDERWEKVRFNASNTAVRADFTLKGRQLRRDYASKHAMTDLLSMLFFARQVDVHQGLTACQHVFGARRLWRMTARVMDSEKMSTPAGRQDAWRVKITFDRMYTPGLNNNKRPHYDMDVYLAKDETHTPLAFVVELKGFPARGDLRRWSIRGKTREDTWAF